MADDFDEAVVRLRRARAVLAARIAKIDRALADLAEDSSPTQDQAPPILDAPDPPEVTSHPMPQPTPAPAVHKTRGGPVQRKRRSGTKSVKRMVIELLEEAARPWTGPEIRDEYIHRGTPIHRVGAKDPVSPIRTALLDLIKDGKVERVGEGVYVATMYRMREPVPVDRDAEMSGRLQVTFPALRKAAV